LLVNVLVALLDWKWGHGIAFTALALLAAAYYAYFSLVYLQALRQSVEQALAEPQARFYLGVAVGITYWYIFALPVLLGQGIGALVLAGVSRQRGWIIGCAIALALTVVAPFLAAWMTRTLSAGIDSFDSPHAIYDRDMRLLQAHLAFVVVLFALQLLYLAYGVRRIRSSTGSRRPSTAATPLPSAQS
ncbi:MAG TPA: hypothetical protein VHR15_11405, partial [Ktedonobacterales bacterium]|nr:hypothetical protein [Ktedonobacterales bacterium]